MPLQAAGPGGGGSLSGASPGRETREILRDWAPGPAEGVRAC